MSKSGDQERVQTRDLIQLAAVLEHLCYAFKAPVELVDIQRAVRAAAPPADSADGISSDEFRLMQAAQQVGIRLAPTRLSLADAIQLVQANFPLVIEESTPIGPSWWVVELKGPSRRGPAHR